MYSQRSLCLFEKLLGVLENNHLCLWMLILFKACLYIKPMIYSVSFELNICLTKNRDEQHSNKQENFIIISKHVGITPC